MRVLINGNEVGTEESGCAYCGFPIDSLRVITVSGKFVCAICGSEWRSINIEVNGRKLFFCCEAHARLFMRLLNEVNRFVNIKLVNKLSITNDVDGKVVEVVDTDGNVHRLKVSV
jgi:hypothetical protein